MDTAGPTALLTSSAVRTETTADPSDPLQSEWESTDDILQLSDEKEIDAIVQPQALRAEVAATVPLAPRTLEVMIIPRKSTKERPGHVKAAVRGASSYCTQSSPSKLGDVDYFSKIVSALVASQTKVIELEEQILQYYRQGLHYKSMSNELIEAMVSELSSLKENMT